jgi:predicted nucleic acid-binding protein
MLHAPQLLDVEIVSALRRQALLGAMTHERASHAVLGFRQIPLRRYPHTGLVERIWEMRHNLSAYDACYVALAEVLDATCLPAMRRFDRHPSAGAMSK